MQIVDGQLVIRYSDGTEATAGSLTYDTQLDEAQLKQAVEQWLEANMPGIVEETDGFLWDTFRWNVTDPDACRAEPYRTGDLYKWYTGYIPVTPGEVYYCLHVTVHAYNEDREDVGTILLESARFTVPDGVAWVVLESGLTASGDVMPDSLNLLRRGYGRENLTYMDRGKVSYEESIPVLSEKALAYFKAFLGNTTPLAGKKIAFIGDSFTSPGVWTREMCSQLNAIHHINKAIGGGSFATYNGYRKTAYEQAQEIVSGGYTPDYILITLGTNDSANRVPVGSFTHSTDIADFDLSTFWGGLQACINYLQNHFPDAVILIGWTPAGGLNMDDSNEYLNAMKSAALRYGVQYIETRTCGMTPLSEVYADCYENGTRGGHPTNAGQLRIGAYMARLLNGYL